jgi:hypothetical protein
MAQSPAANIAGNFGAGADLYLALQQAKLRKAQMAALADYREQALEERHEAMMERTKAQHDALQERADNDLKRRQNDARRNEIMQESQTIRQNIGNARIKLASAKNDAERDALNAKINNWQSQLSEKQSEHDDLMELDQNRLDETTKKDAETAKLNAQKLQEDSIAKNDSAIEGMTKIVQAGDPKMSIEDAELKARDMVGQLNKSKQRAALLPPATGTTPFQPNAAPTAPGVPALVPQTPSRPVSTAAATAVAPVVAPAPAPVASKIKVRSPQGKVGLIPAEQLNAAKAQGYTPIQ